MKRIPAETSSLRAGMWCRSMPSCTAGAAGGRHAQHARQALEGFVECGQVQEAPPTLNVMYRSKGEGSRMPTPIPGRTHPAICMATLACSVSSRQ